ncbi:MAG: CBS domain-containing protein [Acidobacteriota bacterium]|nr:CBS domain-containing protein [Acidobacteriota bacterium]
MTTIQEILHTKGHEVWSVTPTATVFQALELLADKRIGAVLVVESERPVGIFSERDYARKVVLEDRTARETTVADVMTSNPVCIRPEQTIDEAMALMTAKRFRHLPVIQSDRLVGLVSIGDVVKAKISEQTFAIQQLENYITS